MRLGHLCRKITEREKERKRKKERKRERERAKANEGCSDIERLGPMQSGRDVERKIDRNQFRIRRVQRQRGKV